MICANCGTANEAGAKFCNECGAAVSAGCPNCGAINKPGAKFCNECGTTLGTTSAATRSVGSTAPGSVAATSVAERRLVTVLFADLVGFTPFAEERDAEDVRATLSRYFDLCSEIVTRYGGTVEKFIGDAVMAVWGAPTAHEDDAERAVRAALELVDSVHALGPNVQARAGLLTGEAAITLGATNQGLVAGDLVNTAARLQSVAPTGTVLVGEGTFRSASNAIAFEQAGDQALKGKQSPVPAWRAVRVVAERGGRNRSDGLEAPFVGRADELRLLKDLLQATGREQRTRLVSVMGPGGIGKSRLAWEFLKYIDGLVETIYWHSGRSPAYGEGITFWALGEMVRGRCSLNEGDDEATTRAKVAATVAEWISEEEEREWVESALLTLLGIGSETAPDQLFSAWRTFFERISEQGTVALVFEDLHHADSGTLDFIDHLLEWSRGHPILVLTLARPELLDRRPDWGAGKRNFTSIFLEPLPQAQMRELLAGLVPGLPERAIQSIVQRADGIPLYAVEIVRMLLADGRLKEETGAYVPIGDLSTLAVPETLTALIASRLDALEPSDRALIHDAAVLGQSFAIDALSAVSGVPSADLEERIAVLVRRELLTHQADARSPERGQIAFVQALIREVAYNTLARNDRKVRHIAAARYFEQLGSDELASALAGHYLAAQQNALDGPEADALAAQARVALRAAADRAVSLGSHDQAIAFYGQALKVTNDLGDQADLLEKQGESAGIATRYDLSRDALNRTRDLRAGLGDRLGAARAAATLGYVLLNSRHDQDALDLLGPALAEYADLGNVVVADLKTFLARAYLQFERYPEAIKLCDEALDVAEHADAPISVARGLLSKGAAMGAIGRLREGIALIRAGESLAREHDHSELMMAGLVILGYNLGEVDNLEALKCYREGLAIARRVGHRAQMLQFINNIGYTAFLTGDWDEGLAEMDAVLAEDLDMASRAWILSNDLIIRASRGEDVGQGIAEAERLVEGHGERSLTIPTYDTKANWAQAQGRFDDARAAWHKIAESWASQAPASYYQAARPSLWSGDVEAAKADLESLDATGFHGHVVEARRTTLRAGIAALEERLDDALTLYREALVAWRDLSVTWEEALTGIDMVLLLDPTEPDVASVAESTRAILERLGAKPYIDRLDEALARSVSIPSVAVTPPAAESKIAVESA